MSNSRCFVTSRWTVFSFSLSCLFSDIRNWRGVHNKIYNVIVAFCCVIRYCGTKNSPSFSFPWISSFLRTKSWWKRSSKVAVDASEEQNYAASATQGRRCASYKRCSKILRKKINDKSWANSMTCVFVLMLSRNARTLLSWKDL